jgi:hypothetical protein
MIPSDADCHGPVAVTKNLRISLFVSLHLVEIQGPSEDVDMRVFRMQARPSCAIFLVEYSSFEVKNFNRAPSNGVTRMVH